jgi:hypothetical protein
MAENNGQTPSSDLVLKITLNQSTGAVQVDGPIGNPLLCMGMLEMAKQAIHDFVKANAGRIVPAASMPMIKPV